MALSASGWKYISSSGATNPLGRGSPRLGSWSLLLAFARGPTQVASAAAGRVSQGAFLVLLGADVLSTLTRR